MAKWVLIRTSTEEQNPENQLKDIETISGKDYILKEEKQSAWKDEERPILEELKKAIREGKVTDLYVWDFDRIHRNRKRFKEFLALLKAFDVKLHSYRQQWFEDLYKIPSPWNEIVMDLMMNVYGHMAEEESRKKSERVKISIRKKGDETLSRKGNKWGRPTLPDKVKDAILEAYKNNQTYKQICSEVYYWDKSNNKKYVSKGAVHKIIEDFKRSNNRKEDVQIRNN